MQISNLRFGFACNSSSTHSVVVYPRGHKLRDKLVEDGEFGWQTFVAASETSKKSWLKTLIHQRLSRFGDETAKRVAESFYPGEEVAIGYIDHQSVSLIPRAYGTKEPSYEFFQDLASYVLRKDVAIHGGNDNEQAATPPASNVEWYKKLPEEVQDDAWVCRKDGDWWVLFNTADGTKITLSFNDEPAERKLAKMPELVDLKITDFCPYACTYCYQGSTHKGGHADDLSTWIYGLQNAQVFEVAIGGGEPTLHPKFKELLQHYGGKDLRINFTTRNLDWLCHNAELVNKACGAFAFSVDDYHPMAEAVETITKAGLKDKLVLQYVMGTNSDWVFESLVKFCKEKYLKLTLLGYKTTGRGEKGKKSLTRDTKIQDDPKKWIPFIKKNGWHVAIDTALAAHVPAKAFDEYTLRRLEGTHSMYIDAVTNQAGVSSYSDQPMVAMRGKYADAIEESFRTLQQLVAA